MKKAGVKYYLYDDGYFDYTPLVEPTSQASMLGYKAIAWNTDLSMTGVWQGHNVIGITTNDKLFDINKETSQAVQIQKTWNPHDVLPWLWEASQGIHDKFVMAVDEAMSVSWGNNLRQGNLLGRWEDVSHILSGTDHGQRLWIQPIFFDNKYPNRPMEVYRDPYTNYEDIVVNVPIRPGTHTDYFDFSESASIQQNAHSDLLHIKVTQSRWQFDNLLRLVEQRTGIELQNETGYWSLIQAGVTIEMASFPQGKEKWGIGHQGAQQMIVENLEMYDF